jgi:hypothetical protein
MLAESSAAQIPLHKGSKKPDRVESPDTVRSMQVDFQEAGRKWDVASAFLKELFSGE